MSVFRQFRDVFRGSAATPELALAQWQTLSRQIPLLYFMLITNTLILALSYLHAAPALLAIYIPALLIGVCLFRTILWWRSRKRAVTPGEARRRMNGMIWLGAALGLVFTSWSLSLFGYGDAYLRSHVAFYLGITTIGCMFCLLNVRAALVVVGLCTIVPFTSFFALSGEPTFIAFAVNMALAVSVLLIIMLNTNRDFAALIASRTAIVERQRETQRLLEENHKLANLDSLTGVPNRRCFNQQLTDALTEATRDGRSITVARIDIDHFKAVNEIFGQITGDQMLVEIARRITAVKRHNTLLARLDGDNFALIMHEPTDAAAQQRCADTIQAVFQQPFDMPLGTVRVSASMGIAASQPGDSAETLFDHADYATWVAKRDARGGAVLFSDAHAGELTKYRQMEHLLEVADLDAELHIALQPQFDVAIGATVGFEVLARWRNPILGEISPAEFIPMAERTGQISRVTQAVLRKALAACEDLPNTIRLSVNLSAHDIGSPAAIEQIVAMVKDHGKPCRLDFEITETAVMRDLERANQSLLALLGLGARIALDDFGTGHSSLTHVQKLPLHRIKVDRSFVMEVTSDPASRAIVKTMVDLCRNLGLSCVFEGIETREQLDALTMLGGRTMQGYLFGRPMPPEEVEPYLTQEFRRLHRAS